MMLISFEAKWTAAAFQNQAGIVRVLVAICMSRFTTGIQFATSAIAWHLASSGAIPRISSKLEVWLADRHVVVEE